MSDFDNISDEELIDEVMNRSLENKFTKDLKEEIEELEDTVNCLESDIADYQIDMTNLQNDSLEREDLREVMELFRSNNTEKLNESLSSLFYDMFGVIC